MVSVLWERNKNSTWHSESILLFILNVQRKLKKNGKYKTLKFWHGKIWNILQRKGLVFITYVTHDVAYFCLNSIWFGWSCLLFLWLRSLKKVHFLCWYLATFLQYTFFRIRLEKLFFWTTNMSCQNPSLKSIRQLLLTISPFCLKCGMIRKHLVRSFYATQNVVIISNNIGLYHCPAFATSDLNHVQFVHKWYNKNFSLVFPLTHYHWSLPFPG